jgi:hypothetical protein
MRAEENRKQVSHFKVGSLIGRKRETKNRKITNISLPFSEGLRQRNVIIMMIETSLFGNCGCYLS